MSLLISDSLFTQRNDKKKPCKVKQMDRGGGQAEVKGQAPACGAGHSKSNSQIQPFFSSSNFTTIYFPSAPGSEEAGVRMDHIHLNACRAQTSAWLSRSTEHKCKMNTQRRNEYLMMIINCLDCCLYTIRLQRCSCEEGCHKPPKYCHELIQLFK